MSDYFYQFGVAAAWALPDAGNLSTPSYAQRIFTLQNVDVEFTGKLVPLRGQSQWPDDVAHSDKTLTIKAGFGRINIDNFNALFFGDTVSTGSVLDARDELQNVPATSTYTITVTNSATFSEDLGVLYQANGNPLQKVAAASEATGKYSVVESGSGKGVYTFAVGDASAKVAISYRYTSSTGRTLAVTNHVQGYGPEFKLILDQPYNGSNAMVIYRCKCSKMSAPMKRDNYIISDFEAEAYATTGIPSKVFDWIEGSSA